MADGGDAPDDSILDLTKKKKKKKPKDDASGAAAPAEKEADENLTTEPKSTKEKKSKNVAFAGETTENQENVSNEAATPTATATAAAAAPDDDDENILSKRRKKKTKGRDALPTTETDAQATVTSETSEGATATDGTSVQGEYSYEDLLIRVFRIIRAEKGDGEGEGERYKLILKPPQVARIGTKRTSFSNFGEICRSLKRQDKHLHQYLLAELGTNGSIDMNSALIIKGRFQQKQIESVLRSYIKEYVICKTCRSADTILQKEERLTVLFCNTCRSRYFVTGIKTGFQAQVGKRAATRAKAT